MPSEKPHLFWTADPSDKRRMSESIRDLSDILFADEPALPSPWHLKVVQSGQCLSYVAWNTESREAILVDPKREDTEAYCTVEAMLPGFTWLAVFDTHTHADHVSCAALFARELKTTFIMHRSSPSGKVTRRVEGGESLPSRTAPLHMLHTPGHAPDSLTLFWGPFIFGGDTLLFGDTGRDDLPGGDAEAHFESIRKIVAFAKPEMILLPGHDHRGGRASSWKTQLLLNPSLTQTRDVFVPEARAFKAPPPADMDEALKKNSE